MGRGGSGREPSERWVKVGPKPISHWNSSASGGPTFGSQGGSKGGPEHGPRAATPQESACELVLWMHMTLNPRDRAVRDAALREYRAGGASLDACARQFHLSINRVHELLGDHHPRRQRHRQRNIEVRRLRDEGLALREIAERFGMSISNVRAILARTQSSPTNETDRDHAGPS